MTLINNRSERMKRESMTCAHAPLSFSYHIRTYARTDMEMLSFITHSDSFNLSLTLLQLLLSQRWERCTRWNVRNLSRWMEPLIITRDIPKLNHSLNFSFAGMCCIVPVQPASWLMCQFAMLKKVWCCWGGHVQHISLLWTTTFLVDSTLVQLIKFDKRNIIFLSPDGTQWQSPPILNVIHQPQHNKWPKKWQSFLGKSS